MRRVVGWWVFIAALVALGALIHATAEPVPAWTAVAPPGVRPAVDHLLDGEAAFLTLGEPEANERRGPLVLRDARTGAVRQAVGDEGSVWPYAGADPSADRRRVVIRSGEDTLVWMDAADGTSRRLTFDRLRGWELSPDGARLLVEDHERGDEDDAPRSRLHVIEWAGGRTALPSRWGSQPRWSPDGAFFAFRERDALALYDPARRRVLARLPGDGGQFALGPDGKALWRQPARDAFEVWRLDDPAAPRRTATVTAACDEPTFSPDDGLWFLPRYAEPPAPAGSLAVWDTRRGQRRWETTLDAGALWRVTFSPAGRDAAVGAEPNWGRHSAVVPVLVLDARDGTERWRTEATENLSFGPDGETLVRVRSPLFNVHSLLPVPPGLVDRVDAFDAASGASREVARLPFEAVARPRFAGRLLWLHGHRDPRPDEEPPWWLSWLRPAGAERGLLLGLEWPSGRTAFRLARRGLCDYLAADDGSFVVTFQDEPGRTAIRRYDVPQPRPWAWAAGTPLLAGVALLGLRAWWDRRRKERP